jgi:hypothetical protein
MKLIFLDIDGVMNHRNFFERSRLHELQEFCPVAVRNLREIIKRTGAYIVLSSTWRLGLSVIDIRLLFSHYDLDQYIIGKTPLMEDQIRGNEIKQLLSEVNAKVESFVILDDDSDMGELLPYLIHCKDYSGLSDERREEAIKILMAYEI